MCGVIVAAACLSEERELKRPPERDSLVAHTYHGARHPIIQVVCNFLLGFGTLLAD